MIKTCSQCGFSFNPAIPGDPDFVIHTANIYADWCDDCFIETPTNLKYKKTTVMEFVLMDILHEKTRQSLKQRALDKKKKVGKTTKRKDEDSEPETDGLIFYEPND